jgi:hypothetical protein
MLQAAWWSPNSNRAHNLTAVPLVLILFYFFKKQKKRKIISSALRKKHSEIV